MRRIIISIAVGTFFQLLVFLPFKLGPLLPNQDMQAPLLLRLIFGLLMLAMPGYWLFVQGPSNHPTLIRAFAIGFDIALYSIIVYSILWWREGWSLPLRLLLKCN